MITCINSLLERSHVTVNALWTKYITCFWYLHTSQNTYPNTPHACQGRKSWRYYCSNSHLSEVVFVDRVDCEMCMNVSSQWYTQHLSDWDLRKMRMHFKVNVTLHSVTRDCIMRAGLKRGCTTNMRISLRGYGIRIILLCFFFQRFQCWTRESVSWVPGMSQSLPPGVSSTPSSCRRCEWSSFRLVLLKMSEKYEENGMCCFLSSCFKCVRCTVAKVFWPETEFWLRVLKITIRKYLVFTSPAQIIWLFWEYNCIWE